MASALGLFVFHDLSHHVSAIKTWLRFCADEADFVAALHVEVRRSVAELFQIEADFLKQDFVRHDALAAFELVVTTGFFDDVEVR